MIRGESSVNQIRSYLAQGKWEQVVEACQKALAADPEALEFYLYLAKAYSQLDKLTDAVEIYQMILGTSVNQAEIYAELGLLFSKLERSDQAAQHYQQALKLEPNWPELQYNLAVVFHQSGDWQQAIDAYNQAVKIKPSYAAAYFNLGVLYDQKGELDAAISAYQQVIAIQPNFIRALSNLGSAFVQQKDYPQAIAAFKRGLSVDPTWAILYNNLGQVYWFESHWGLALESFETAISLEPKMALAHHNLGRLWQHRGDYVQASQYYGKVVELEPKNISAYGNYADVLYKIGNIESALSCWRRIIELEPSFVNAYAQRKLAHSPQNLLEITQLACAKFLQALKQGEQKEALHHLWRTHSYLGDILFEVGGVRQAEQSYHKALQIYPENPELYLKLGNCLARQQRLNAAVAAYQQGLFWQEDQSQICFQLGKLLERTQDATQALDCYETVLEQQVTDYANLDNLPVLFPTEINAKSLPAKIYHRTQDWVRDCALKDFNYTQVVWSEEEVSRVYAEGARQPEALQIIPGGSSYSDCGGVTCARCMNKLIKHFKPVQLGQNVYQCSLAQAPPIVAELPFVVTIPQGRSWMAPYQNSWVVCDALAVMTPDNYLLGDLSRNYPWFLPGCPYQERLEHSIFEQESLAPIEKVSGKVALLTTLSGHVYYHWMFDLLPRLELLRRSGMKLKDIDWFVVNSLERPFQRETLGLLGIPPEKIIESDRQSHIEAEELIVPSFPGYFDWIPEGTIKFLRQTFLPQISLATSTTPAKIYVSRARAKHRQLINEIEVREFLESEGFKVVYLEEMSVLEQVTTFANAKVIVTPHGSGLTNIVFCSSRTKIIELFAPSYIRTDYWMISQHLELQHYYVVGENFNCVALRSLMYQTPLTEDILVNIDALKLVVQHA